MAQRLTQLLPSVYATAPEPLFGGAACARAYLVLRPGKGNVWVYASSKVKQYLEHIQELGGVSMQLLNHRDEAGKFCNILDAPVFCHELEKEAIQGKSARVDVTYSGEKHILGDDLTAYHTPGHAVGVTSYVWKDPSSDTSILFPGDTLYATGSAEDSLASGPLHIHTYGRNKEDMVATLSKFQSFNPTYILPGLSTDTVAKKFVFNYKADVLAKLEQSLL